MSDFVFNIAKGRVVELYRRVKAADPANCAFLVVILASSGLESDTVLIDKETLAAVFASTTREVTNVNYARKIVVAVDLSTLAAPDHANDISSPVGLPTQTWSNVASGDSWAKALICYTPNSSVIDDTTVVPLVALDISYAPSGTSVSIELPRVFAAF